VRALTAAISLALLCAAGVAGALAPFGVWENRLLGQPAWSESDPGAFYVAAAHELAWGEPARFVGHPGTPLMLLLRVVQEGYYRLDSPGDLSFSAFTARRLAAVYALSKLAVGLLHGLSFWLLYRFARALTRSERAACFAVLGYATSLPVLYYLSRISVEPLITISFCGAFLALWRYEEQAGSGRAARGLGWVALAALAAVTGAVSKFNFLGPLPLFLAGYLLLAGRRAARRAIPERARGLALVTFAAAAGAATLVYSQWIGWRDFFAFWRLLAGATGTPPGWRLGPATPHGILLSSELAFAALGVAGFFLLLRRAPRLERSRALWTAAYGAYTVLLFGYRIGVERSLLPFHYFWLAGALLAVYFGVAVESLLRRLPERSARAAVLGVALVLFAHGLALYAVFDSRRYDAAEYARYRPLFALIAELSPRELVAMPSTRAGAPPQFVIVSPPLDSRHYRLADEFAALFTPVPPASLARDPRRVRVPGLDAEFGVAAGTKARQN